MKKEKSTFGWIFTFAGSKKSGYIISVCLAVIGAAFQVLPFFVMATIVVDWEQESFCLFDRLCCDVAVLAFAGIVPLAVHGTVPQSDLCCTGKHPKTRT